MSKESTESGPSAFPGLTFPGFREERIDVGSLTLFCRIGGEGPPLLLLHGYPQTGAMWHPVAGELAKDYTVIIPDLRGYGRSDKPEGDAGHHRYSKRTMAADIANLMGELGHPHFAVIGHDRGARVTHRLCLDHGERVDRAAVLDIIPTRTLFLTADRFVSHAYYHWYFLAQPRPLPETLIGRDPDAYLAAKFGGLGGGVDFFVEAAMAEYRAAFRQPATIPASCEDYRAAASVDFDHDDADADRLIECPLLVLWGSKGPMGRYYDVLSTWQERARHATGHAVEAGHFLIEENPNATLDSLRRFLKDEPLPETEIDDG